MNSTKSQLNTPVFFVCFVLAICCGCFTQAEIITRAGEGMVYEFTQNTGIKTLPIQVRASNNEPGIVGYLTDIVIVPPSSIGTADLIGPLGPSTFDQIGYIGESNIRAGFASYFTRQSATTAQLSLEFIEVQPLLSTFETLASFQIDSTGLPLGDYAVVVNPVGVVDLLGTNFSINKIDTTFRIVAVPEPSAMFLCGVSLVSLSCLRRNRAFNLRIRE